MKKLAAVALVLAVAVMFAIPAMAAESTCAKPECNTCAKTKTCPTCGQPCNILQSTANVINSMEAPTLPCSKPCAKPCAKPCSTCAK